MASTFSENLQIACYVCFRTAISSCSSSSTCLRYMCLKHQKRCVHCQRSVCLQCARICSSCFDSNEDNAFSCESHLSECDGCNRVLCSFTPSTVCDECDRTLQLCTECYKSHKTLVHNLCFLCRESGHTEMTCQKRRMQISDETAHCFAEQLLNGRDPMTMHCHIESCKNLLDFERAFRCDHCNQETCILHLCTCPECVLFASANNLACLDCVFHCEEPKCYQILCSRSFNLCCDRRRCGRCAQRHVNEHQNENSIDSEQNLLLDQTRQKPTVV